MNNTTAQAYKKLIDIQRQIDEVTKHIEEVGKTKCYALFVIRVEGEKALMLNKKNLEKNFYMLGENALEQKVTDQSEIQEIIHSDNKLAFETVNQNRIRSGQRPLSFYDEETLY